MDNHDEDSLEPRSSPMINRSIPGQPCQRTERSNMSFKDMSLRVDSEAVTKAVTCLSLQLVVASPPCEPEKASGMRLTQGR